ncbi:MAG: hypothetical protein JXR88_08545 [Clostridia bacterium]|nr:hypothetical protein [Clostridia bacterium]
MKLEIPGYESMMIHHILFDYNGTIANDGHLLNIQPLLNALSKDFKVYVLTGDTYGNVREQFQMTNVTLVETKTGLEKGEFIETLNPKTCIAIGNGTIDRHMLKKAAISIAVIGHEGCSTQAILNSDLVVKSIEEAISLIVNPIKLIATLKE